MQILNNTAGVVGIQISDEASAVGSTYEVQPWSSLQLRGLRVYDTNGVFLASDSWGNGHTLVYAGGSWVDIPMQGPKGLLLDGMAWGFGFVGVMIVVWATIKGLSPRLPNADS